MARTEHDAQNAPYHGGTQSNQWRAFDGVAQVGEEFLHGWVAGMSVGIGSGRLLAEVAVDDVPPSAVEIIELKPVARPCRKD